MTSSLGLIWKSELSGQVISTVPPTLLPQLLTPSLVIHFTKGLGPAISEEEERRNRKKEKLFYLTFTNFSVNNKTYFLLEKNVDLLSSHKRSPSNVIV